MRTEEIENTTNLPTDENCPEMWGGEWAHDQDGEHPTGEELDAADIFFEKFGRELENNEDDVGLTLNIDGEILWANLDFISAIEWRNRIWNLDPTSYPGPQIKLVPSIFPALPPKN